MITITAVGYCKEKPSLRVFQSGAQKCEFEVVDKSFRKVGDNKWEPIYEAATFVAWGDQAQLIAEKLEAGTNLEATGRQETSHWIDEAGKHRSRVLFKLYDFKVIPRPRTDQSGQANREAPAGEGASSEPSAQREATTQATNSYPRRPSATARAPAESKPSRPTPPKEFKMDY